MYARMHVCMDEWINTCVCVCVFVCGVGVGDSQSMVGEFTVYMYAWVNSQYVCMYVGMYVECA
jgi:hypothetical protein